MTMWSMPCTFSPPACSLVPLSRQVCPGITATPTLRAREVLPRALELLDRSRESPAMPPTDEAVRLARLQAIFYIVSGVWPFVSIRSFEAVTGPKVDRWLVKTVG